MTETLEKKSSKTMLIVTIVVAILIVGKVTAGIITSSSALISDAIHSIMDLVIAVASLIGLKLVQKPPDKRFSYGYYKVENIITFFISLVILASSGELIYEGILRIIEVPELSIPYLAIGMSIFSSIVSLLLGLYLRKVAKQTNSPTIKSNAQDKLMDTGTSLVVFAAILASFFSIKYVEGIVTILISLLSIYVGITIAKDSILSLLDVADKELKEKVQKTIEEVEGVINCHNLRLRPAGAYHLGDCEIKADASMGFEEAHDLTMKVEKKVKEEYPAIISFVVHIEPTKKEKRKIIIPITEMRGLDSKVGEHFGKAERVLLVVISVPKREILEVKEIENPFRGKKKNLVGFALTKLVMEEEINTVITKNVGEISYFKLKGENVDVFKAECEKVADCIEKIWDEELPLLDKPTKEKDDL